MLFLRALFAFLALPGMVAFALPAWWLWRTGHTTLVYPPGLASLVIGVIGLVWCVRDFYVSGKGTLAPWSPPQYLVVVGLYRYSRNPMYVSVALILVGWTITFASKDLLAYTLIVIVAFHLRVVLGEEPWLAGRHGDAWDDYAKRVRRWF